MFFIVLILILLYLLSVEHFNQPALMTNQTYINRLSQIQQPVRTRIIPYPPPLEMITMPRQYLRQTVPPYTPLPYDNIACCGAKKLPTEKLPCFPKNIRYTKNMFSETTPMIDGVDGRVNSFISTTIPRETPPGSF